jgi:hypothetical protein
MMSLGHELGADDDVETAVRHLVEFLPQTLHRLDQIAGQDDAARLRKQRRHFFLQAFHARPDRREGIRCLAFRAGRRQRLGEAAMMADQPPPEPVIHQPGVAIRTIQPVAAFAAQRQRRIAAAIEKQQRLLAALDRGLHRFGEPWCDEAPARRALARHVDGFNMRHLLAAETLRQRQPPVAPAPRIHFGFHRRRR